MSSQCDMIMDKTSLFIQCIEIFLMESDFYYHMISQWEHSSYLAKDKMKVQLSCLPAGMIVNLRPVLCLETKMICLFLTQSRENQEGGVNVLCTYFRAKWLGEKRAVCKLCDHSGVRTMALSKCAPRTERVRKSISRKNGNWELSKL